MSAVGTQRPSVRVAPAGVRACLEQTQRSAERDLVEYLLASPPGQPLDLSRVATHAGRPVADLARAVFQLNRSASLLVADGPQAGDGPSGLAGLSRDLEALVGGHCGVICDHDGLCVAAAGWTVRQADKAAALVATRSFAAQAGARWWFSSGEVTLAATAPLDPASPAWVRIARRLLYAFGPLGMGAAT